MTNPWKRIKELEKEVGRLKLASLLKADFNDPNPYIEKIIERKVEWFDYKKMDIQQQLNYYNDAQQVVNGEIFNNELHHYMADLIRFNAIEAKDFDQVMNVRTGIVTLETFKDRLSKIENPYKEQSKEDIYNAI